MKPLSLRLQNFRSFRVQRDFDFSQLHLFAIIGDTGVGKSSILEAIAYALFGQANTYEGRGTNELIADGTRSGSVEFTFSVEGTEYVVRRILRPNNAQVHLWSKADNVELSRGARAVNEKVEDILCMDFKSFMHTVLLPQGMHTRLLKSTEVDRTRVLSQLFKLESLDDIAKIAADEDRRARNYLDVLDVQLDDFGTNIEQRIAAAESEVAATRTAYEAATAASGKVDAIDIKLKALNEGKASLGTQATRLAGIDAIEEAFNNIDSLDNRELAPELRAIQNRYEEASEAKAEAKGKVDGLAAAGTDTATLRHAERCLTQLATAAATLQGEADRRNTILAEVSELQRAVSDFEDKLSATKQQNDTIAAALTDALADRATVRVSMEAIQAAYTAVKKAELELSNAESVLADFTKQRLLAKKNCAEAAALVSQVASELRVAEDKFGAAQQRDRIAAIAGHLHSGEECPVCQRLLPKGFAPPENADIDSARIGVDVAHAALIEANRKAESERLAVNTLETELRNASLRADEVKGEAHDARGKLSALLLSTTKVELELRRLSKKAEELDDLVRDLQRDKSEVDARVVTESQAVTKAQTTAASLERQIDESKRRSAGADAAFASASSRLPEQYRTFYETSAIARMQQYVSLLATQATEVEAGHLAAVNAFASVADERRAAEEDYGVRVQLPRSQMLDRLAVVAEAIDDVALPKAPSDEKKWVTQVIKAAKQRSGKIVKEIAKLERLFDEGRLARFAIVTQAGDEPQRLVQDLSLRVRDAENALAYVRSSAERAADLVKKRQRVADISMGLSGLRTAMLPASFPTFATRQRQRRLIEEATVILRSISNGQFSFTTNLEVFDSYTNAQRSTHSLSGGEAFQASVALSLAAVQVASNAGNKIESLFLDEGFDALDSDRLGSVMLELRKRAQAGRTICVISHVSQVTEYVDKTWHVFKTTSGTDYKVLGSLDEDEATVEGLITHIRTPSQAQARGTAT